MKLTNVEKKENFQVELSITVESAEFEAGMVTAYNKIKNLVNVPGFRKGKAPRKMIEKLYGAEVFYEDAIEACYPAAVEAACKEADIEPIAITAITEADVQNGELLLKVDLQLKPELTVKAYKGLEGKKETAEVTDVNVLAELTRMAEQNARQVSVERAAQAGDVVKIDFEGFCGGEAFDGGKAEGYDLKLGSGMFIPGFEEQVAGHNIGEEFDVNVIFPTEYQAAELAGKPATFKCKLHEITEIQLPEIDDEFAKDVSEFDTLDELKADIKKNMTESAERNAERFFEEALMKQLRENLEGEIPEVMIEKELDFIMNDYAMNIAMQSGMSFDKYLEMSGLNVDMFRQMFRGTADERVKTRLALEAVVRAENIEVSEEEIEAEFKKMAEQYNMEIDAVKAQVAVSGLKMDLAVNKAVEVIKANAVAPAAEDEAAEEAPKKTRKTTKKTTKKETEEVSENATEKAEDNE